MTRRILYLDSYTIADPAVGAPSSDAIGYGITGSRAIREGFLARGWQLRRPYGGIPSPGGGSRAARAQWIVAGYPRVLDELANGWADAVFEFHVFNAFPVEIRRMLLDLGQSVPFVGYTHGSHWDDTDAFRFENYPGLELADLANLHVLDRVLLVSEHMRTVLCHSLSEFHPALAAQLLDRTRVVGLPLDTALLDACRTEERFERITVVFNHAPVSSKNPELFVEVMGEVMSRYPVQVMFTRRFPAEGRAGRCVTEFASRFPGRVVLGDNLPLPEYYRVLWMADIQVSTALHETLGVSTLEAMYTETCCILPRLGSYPEICDDHGEVLYDLGAGGLAERLEYFLDHPEARRRVGRELSTLAKRYRPADVVDRIAGVLDELWGA